MRRGCIFALVLVFLLCPALSTAYSYSVLTHEAVVDTLWRDSIEPLIRQRFPHVTKDQLKEAHAYAYGGCIIQDSGYYPFGSHNFTDFTHYIRSGDFVVAMLREARDPNEYAFALGALAHYAADNTGHPLAVNRSVPLLYPELRRKYGDVVTYAENPKRHVQTEFGFDVLQVARGRYASDAYHDFIGFKVSKPILERAFPDVYGLELQDVFVAFDLAMGSYRKSVSSLIPKMTQVAWQSRKDEIVREIPTMTRDRFLYNLSRTEYEKAWGHQYQKPGPGSQLLSFVMRIVPPIGPFKAVAFRVPTPETEQLFMKSFNATVDRYRMLLRDERAGILKLPNENFDLGTPTKAGMYEPADKAYASLVNHLSKRDFADASPELRRNILAFYDSAPPPDNRKTADELNRLRSAFR